MRITLSVLTMLIFIFSLHGTASAGYFDTLKKLADKDSKERKLLTGAGDVLASSQGMSYESERVVGEGLALEGLQRYGKPVDNPGLQKYVNLVGNALAANSQRPEITYQFVVVDNDLQNAFACPGGIIFVSKALFNILDSEAELAGILAHEIGHVGYKHAIKSTKRTQLLSGLGKITAATMRSKDGKKVESLVGDLQTVLFDKGLDKKMEFESDAIALTTASRTGYDPAGLYRVLNKLRSIEKSTKKKDKKGSWFSTHPPLKDRIEKMAKNLKKYKNESGLVTVPDRFLKYKKMLTSS